MLSNEISFCFVRQSLGGVGRSHCAHFTVQTQFFLRRIIICYIYIYLNLIESKLKSRREDQDYLPVNKSGRLNFFSFYFSYAISILQLHSNEQREEGKVRQREKVIRDEQQNFCAEHRRGWVNTKHIYPLRREKIMVTGVSHTLRSRSVIRDGETNRTVSHQSISIENFALVNYSKNIFQIFSFEKKKVNYNAMQF